MENPSFLFWSVKNLTVSHIFRVPRSKFLVPSYEFFYSSQFKNKLGWARVILIADLDYIYVLNLKKISSVETRAGRQFYTPCSFCELCEPFEPYDLYKPCQTSMSCRNFRWSLKIFHVIGILIHIFFHKQSTSNFHLSMVWCLTIFQNWG